MHIKKFDQNTLLNSFRKLFSKNKFLHEPKFNSADQFHLLKCLKSTMVSTAGMFLNLKMKLKSLQSQNMLLLY